MKKIIQKHRVASYSYVQESVRCLALAICMGTVVGPTLHAYDDAGGCHYNRARLVETADVDESDDCLNLEARPEQIMPGRADSGGHPGWRGRGLGV